MTISPKGEYVGEETPYQCMRFLFKLVLITFKALNGQKGSFFLPSRTVS